jgi:hypothetical protein
MKHHDYSPFGVPACRNQFHRRTGEKKVVQRSVCMTPTGGRNSQGESPRVHYNIHYERALRIIPHASSANDRPTLGFFLALTFDNDDAPPSRTRVLESWFASSSSASLRPSPTRAAFRLATVVVDLDEREEPEEKERYLFFFELASFFFALVLLVSSNGVAVADGSGRGGRPFALRDEMERGIQKKMEMWMSRRMN